MGTGMTAVQPGTYALNTGNTQTGAAQPQTPAAVQPEAEQKSSPAGRSLNPPFLSGELTPAIPEQSETEGKDSPFGGAVEQSETEGKGSPFGGAVERSETEGVYASGKTQADTALKEYQTRVADAIQAGDYERAYALYREYRNPELRAFKDFYARKTFTEYADANGYGLHTDTAGEFTQHLPVESRSQDTESTNAEERLIEDESVRNFRNDIKEGKVSLRISPQKQARHILGSKEHHAYRERLSNRGDFPAYIREDLSLADLYEIVKERAGTGIIEKKADKSFKEFVDCDEIIGYYYHKEEEKYVPTYRTMIIYSLGDQNIHVIPVKKPEREEK